MPRVLLLDDSAVVRAVLRKRLAAEGFEVVEVASLATLPAALEVTVAVLDLELDDGDSLGVAARLLDAGVAVAFFSAADADLRARAEALAPLFAKPEALDALCAWARSYAGS